MAACIARDGFTGARMIFEGKQGMAAGMSSDSDIGCLTDRLGTRWATAETSFKFHASCRHTHPAADALLALMQEHKLKPDDIVALTAHVHQGALDVALIANLGRAGLADFTDAALREASLRAFHDRVKMVLDPEVDGAYPKRWLGRVSVTTRDGRALEKKIASPKGDPDNVLARPELEDKALRLAGYAGGASEAEMRGVIARAWALHDAPGVRNFLTA
jgi:2-methylcitrate dehydratase PrpD